MRRGMTLRGKEEAWLCMDERRRSSECANERRLGSERADERRHGSAWMRGSWL